MTVHQARPSIVFLALADDLLQATPSKAPTLGEGVRSLAQALAQVGWQVDIFTQPRQPKAPQITQINAYCRVIHLAVESSLTRSQQVADFAQAIQSFEQKAGFIGPLFHTFDNLSAQVGKHLKREQQCRWIHTPWLQTQGFPLQPTAPPADQLVIVQVLAASPSPVSPRDHGPDAQPPRSDSTLTSGWTAAASCLSQLYRQHLAVCVGAMGIEMPIIYTLQVSPSEHDTLPQDSGSCQLQQHTLVTSALALA